MSNNNNTRTVNNNNYYSPVDNWLNAWDDNNNFGQQQTHHQPQPSSITTSTTANSQFQKISNSKSHNIYKNNNNLASNGNFKKPSASVQGFNQNSRNTNLFNDDPWSGESNIIFFILFFNKTTFLCHKIMISNCNGLVKKYILYVHTQSHTYTVMYFGELKVKSFLNGFPEIGSSF